MKHAGVLVVALFTRLTHGCEASSSSAQAAPPLPPLPPAPPAPHGPHPRLALTRPVLAALKAKLGSPGVAAAIAECRKAPLQLGAPDGYQGDSWAFPASACALAWQLTGDAEAAARGVKLWRALLDDVRKIGDGKGCVVGATPKQAIASVERDTGYAIRFVGPHAALAYDWLHDAPGVDEGLRKQSRDCFHAWLDWYGKNGYLRDQPGANYHAGFAFAKTLISIAEAGEDGAVSDRYWRETVETLYGAQIVRNGLAGDNHGVPRGARHGALVGGDWPEGWQYGPLSVIEYAFGARVLAEQGVTFPELGPWSNDLTLRFLHGLEPTRTGMYPGGDAEDTGAYLKASAGPLLATLLGPSDDRAAGWAAFMRNKLRLGHGWPSVFEALAEARAVKPVDPWAAARTDWFLARGTRAVYARSGFGEGAFWSVFTSPPRLVDDHQHVDASNFVFSRGGDPLVVDPSPYGSRSTFTGNALSVDSAVVLGDYKPSQASWSEAGLPWARATRGGVVAARADIAGAFAFGDRKSDVPLARRDWVFLPEGELVTIDRALTGGDARKVYLRFRTPATLTLAPDAARAGMFVARGVTGGSALAIHDVLTRPAATPTVTVVPKGNDCGDKSFGACRVARIPVNDYALEVVGAEVLAVHVLDALGKAEAPAEADAVGGEGPQSSIAGARVARGGKISFVIAGAHASAKLSKSLAYEVPGDVAARHVVFDAPEDGAGRASVKATPSGGRCAVALTSSGGTLLVGRPLVFQVAPAAAGCAITEDPDQPSDHVSR
jgi:hypothetical protein